MRFGGKLPALFALLAAGALIVLTGTGAAATQPGRAAPTATTASLAAPAALDSYLGSAGVDRASLVTQRGARNYAGPNCPGKGWNCTTSTRVLQISTNGGGNGQNRVECSRGDLGSSISQDPQACVILQSGQNNFARCSQRSSSNAASQSCKITQTGKRNVAHVDQSVHAAGADTQTATQTAEVNQTSNGTGSLVGNLSYVDQSVDQSTHRGGDDDDDDNDRRPPSAVQNQDAQQITKVTQIANGSGDNVSRLHQSESMSAKNGVDQNQNTSFPSMPDCAQGPGSPFSPNICANVSQSSTSGKNDSQLKQSIAEDAKTHATGASQQQGNFNGGIDGQVHQDTATGRSSSDADQDKRQRLRGPAGTFQRQFDPIHCCGVSSQDGGTGNRENIRQSASQSASEDDASQQSQLTGSSRSPSGSCSVAQRASNNADTGSNNAEAGPCLLLILATSCVAGGGGGDLTGTDGQVAAQRATGACVESPPVTGGCQFEVCDGPGPNTIRLGRQKH